MFDEINGLPAHPLVVHAAVVFVPLLCLAAIVYAVVPRVRAKVGWAAAALAVVAPVAALLATGTGDELAESRYPGQLPPAVHDHEEFGESTLMTSIVLGLIVLVFVYLTGTRSGRARRLPSWVSMVLAVITVLAALGAGFFVVQTGDSGAQSVWGS